MIVTGNDWQPFFDEEQEKPYYKELRKFLIEEYRLYNCYPAANDIFKAFKVTSFADTRVVMIGQDPYHNPGQATGIAFAVKKGTPEPPSLKNIHKEILAEDVEQGEWSSDTTRWAEQGVLGLNATMTVRAFSAGSHQGHGWETLTDEILKKLGEDDRPRVFMLWGAFARSKKVFITNPNHLILEAPHPSPLSASRGFFGCGHFKKCNEFLKAHNETPIYW